MDLGKPEASGMRFMSLLHPLSPDPDNAAPIIGLGPSLAKAGKVVAVVVTHNRFAQLKQTISALLAVPPPYLQGIVVVDNGSDDGSWGWLSGVQDPRILPLRHSKNLGGAGGFHAGLRAAVSLMDPDWVVVMDDDGRPDDGAIAAFHQTDLSGWDMVAAAVRYPDGAICEMNRPSRNPFWSVGAFWATARRGRSGFHIDPAHYADGMAPVQVDVSSFVGLFISRKTIDLIGYPDPSLFVYGEDGLYTLAASKAGLRIGFFAHIRFTHDCTTFVARDRAFSEIWKAYYYHRNLLHLYRAAAGFWFWPALGVILPKWLWRITRQKHGRGRFALILALAIWDGLWGVRHRSHDQVLRLSAAHRERISR